MHAIKRKDNFNRLVPTEDLTEQIFFFSIVFSNFNIRDDRMRHAQLDPGPYIDWCWIIIPVFGLGL